MFDPLKDRELEKRDKNVPKFSLKNSTDRKILFTISFVVLIVIFVIGIIVGLALNF